MNKLARISAKVFFSGFHLGRSTVERFPAIAAGKPAFVSSGTSCVQYAVLTFCHNLQIFRAIVRASTITMMHNLIRQQCSVQCLLRYKNMFRYISGFIRTGVMFVLNQDIPFSGNSTASFPRRVIFSAFSANGNWRFDQSFQLGSSDFLCPQMMPVNKSDRVSSYPSEFSNSGNRSGRCFPTPTATQAGWVRAARIVTGMWVHFVACIRSFFGLSHCADLHFGQIRTSVCRGLQVCWQDSR